MDSFYSRNELDQLGLTLLGKGTDVLISRKASIYGAERISIDDHVRIDDFCILSGRITIERHVHIAAYSALFGGNAGIKMCSFSGLSSRCAVYAISDDFSGEFLTSPMSGDKFRNVLSRPVILERHVLVGTGSTVLPGVTIGEGSAIGSMSLVKNSLSAWGIYAGIPCKFIKPRSKRLLKYEPLFLEEISSSEQNS